MIVLLFQTPGTISIGDCGISTPALGKVTEAKVA